MSSEEFNPVDEQKTKGKDFPKTMVIIGAILVVIVLAVGMMIANNNAEAVFEKQIDKLFTYEQAPNYETAKMNMDLQMKVEGKQTNEFTDLINDAKLSLVIEQDSNTQEEVIGVQLTKAEENLIDAKAKLDSQSEKLYLNLGELFEKTIEIDSSEMSDSVAEEATEPLNFMQLLNAKKAETILKREIKQQLKSEYFSSEKTTTNDEKMTKNMLKMSGKEGKDVIKNVCTNLSQNDEFINCFKDAPEVKSYLTNLMEQVEDFEISEDTHFEIDLYTKGIVSTIKRIDFVVTQEEEKIAIQMTKVTDEEYNYELLSATEKILEGNIKIQKKEQHSEVEVTAKAEETTVTAKASADMVYDEKLSEFDMDNVVKLENLSVEDLMKLYNNFLGSQLYDVVEGLSGGLSQQDSYRSRGSNKTTNSEVNVLKTYNDELVKFNIPDGFEAYSSDSDTYKLFEKELEDETIQVDVTVQYGTLQEYVDSLKESMKYFVTEDYSDLKVSEPEEIEVNGKSFKKIEISYQYRNLDNETIEHKQTYYVYQVDEENLYTVEIEGSNFMEQNEIETFLTVEK